MALYQLLLIVVLCILSLAAVLINNNAFINRENERLFALNTLGVVVVILMFAVIAAAYHITL